MGKKKDGKSSWVVSLLWILVGITIIYILYRTCEVFIGISLKF